MNRTIESQRQSPRVGSSAEFPETHLAYVQIKTDSVPGGAHAGTFMVLLGVEPGAQVINQPGRLRRAQKRPQEETAARSAGKDQKKLCAK